MFDTFMYYFHFFAEILYYVNPIGMIIACMMWVSIYLRMLKEQDKWQFRYRLLEKQIDYLVCRDNADVSYFNYLRTQYEQREDKRG
jgi:hypothetical protein